MRSDVAEATLAFVAGTDTALPVVVEGVSKAYRIYDHPRDRLRQLFAFGGRRYYEEYWALRDVSFTVRRGEALGIIGRNGQGKSTLLQLLAGTLKPTRGRIGVRGRTAALLELGTGFNPEFTGRENVMFGGMLLGMSREEMQSRVADVVEFAEIGEFIDHPVKTYSSGMFVRLAFALQVSTDPEVLVVDEALSVGDIFFQQKCFERIAAMRARGLTLVFVSHDMTAIRKVCDRALVLERGAIAYEGPPEEAVSRFHNVARPRAAGQTQVAVPVQGHGAVAGPVREDLLRHDILSHARSRHGAGGLEIVAATFANEAGAHDFAVTMRGSTRIRLLVRAESEIASPAVGIHLFDRMSTLVFASGTRQRGVRLPAMAPGDEIVVELVLGMNVQPGEYTFSLGCAEPSPEGENYGTNLDRHEGLGPIVVHADTTRILPFYGVAELPLAIRLEP